MGIEGSFEDKQKFQAQLLEFINCCENVEENFQNLVLILDKQKVRENSNLLKEFLHLITKISNNHNRGSLFFNKIEKIIKLYKEDIKKFYSNREIFNIFKSNKRILLFLIKEEMIKFDQNIFYIITKDKYLLKKYPQYFSPEIIPFLDDKTIQKIKSQEKNDDDNDDYDENDNNWIEETLKELPDDFQKKRLNGENDEHICELIRNDQIEEFIIYVDRNTLSLKTEIETSIYETNSLLFKKNPILIEYAAFFGSIQIFKYLFKNTNIKTEASDYEKSSLWIFAIHGNHPEIIQFLEDENIKPSDNFNKCYIESIKCHHIDITKYIADNFINGFDNRIYIQEYLKYYNFAFIQDDFIDVSHFQFLCKYDYCLQVNRLLCSKWIEINKIYRIWSLII